MLDWLRIAGRAKIVRDTALNNSMLVNGKAPDLALVVEIEEAFMHCAKAMIRSGIWRRETWPDKNTGPKLAEWQIEVVNDGRTFEEVFAAHSDDEVNRLY